MKNLSFLFFMLLLALLHSGKAQPQLELVPFASDLNQPNDIARAGDDRLFVVQQHGLISVIDADGNTSPTPFLDLSEVVSDTGSERGLLGLAFHPTYAVNGYFFVNYTRESDGATIVARYSVDNSNPELADPDSQKILLTIDQPYSNHNGGDLLFGPDGYLYIAVGDGGSSGDPDDNAQTHTTLLGKMLRIDVDQGDPYAIPEDNPFAGDDFTLDEIWALGLRNPWRNSFDKYTGDFWIADVGQNAREEINFQPANSTGGENYGWRCYEGSIPYNPDGCGDPDFYTLPVFDYEHYEGGCTGSITGGYVYRGALYNGLFGRYLAADYCHGDFYAVRQTDEGFETAELGSFSPFQYTSFGEDQYGELYVALRGQGAIHRITDVSDCRPVARIKGDTLLSLPEGETITLEAFYHPSLAYQWSKNEDPIEGANTHLLEVSEQGVFTVEVTNPDNDCQNTSGPVEVMPEETGFAAYNDLPPGKVYPNPASHQITLEGIPGQGMMNIRLLDITGHEVVSENRYIEKNIVMQTRGLPPGVYILMVTTDSFNRSWKVVLEKF